jgi:hypothetical protein
MPTIALTVTKIIILSDIKNLKRPPFSIEGLLKVSWGFLIAGYPSCHKNSLSKPYGLF